MRKKVGYHTLSLHFSPLLGQSKGLSNTAQDGVRSLQRVGVFFVFPRLCRHRCRSELLLGQCIRHRRRRHRASYCRGVFRVFSTVRCGVFIYMLSKMLHLLSSMRVPSITGRSAGTLSPASQNTVFDWNHTCTYMPVTSLSKQNTENAQRTGTE